jgi:hypothetical protein
MAASIDEMFNAFITYMHFVKEEDFDCMYADLTTALSDRQVDPIEFRRRILEYIEKIVSKAPGCMAENGIFFRRYQSKLQRTADTLDDDFA